MLFILALHAKFSNEPIAQFSVAISFYLRFELAPHLTLFDLFRLVSFLDFGNSPLRHLIRI